MQRHLTTSQRGLLISCCLIAFGVSLTACATKQGPIDGPPGSKSPDSSLPAEIRSSGVLKVASDIPYEPFEMFTDTSQTQVTGFDYDLSKALGAELGIRVEFIPQKFDGLIPGLQAGNYDAVISAMTDNLDRQKVVDFVDYFRDGTVVVVKKGNPLGIKTMLDVCGHTVGQQSGSQQVQFVAAQQPVCAANGRPPITIMQFPKESDVDLAMRSGRVDTFLEDSIAAAQTAAQTDNGNAFEVVNDPAAPGGYDAQPGGIAVRKGRDQLVHSLADALQRLIDNGTYRALLKKYDMELGAVSKATINIGDK